MCEKKFISINEDRKMGKLAQNLNSDVSENKVKNSKDMVVRKCPYCGKYYEEHKDENTQECEKYHEVRKVTDTIRLTGSQTREEVSNIEALQNFADAVVSDKRFTIIIDNTIDKNCNMRKKKVRSKGRITEAVVFEWKFAEINKLMISNIEYFLNRYGGIYLQGMKMRSKISNVSYATPFGDMKVKKVQYILYKER